MDWQAIALTLKLAVTTSAVLFALGLPLAAWLANSSWKGRIFVESVVALPLVLPPTVLGFYVLLAFGPRSPLGRWYQNLFGGTLPFSFEGLVLASVLYSLPFTVQPFTAAIRSVDRRLVEASWSLGAGRLRTFRQIVLPLARPGLLVGLVLGFAHTLGEFGVVLMVGGNIPGVTRTASISIYDSVQGLDYEAAGRTSMALLLFSFAVLSLTYWLQHRSQSGSASR